MEKRKQEREREKIRVQMANFLASSYWNVSIRRYEKRQREIITRDGLCWPEKVLILPRWRAVGRSSMEAGTQGTYFMLM